MSLPCTVIVLVHADTPVLWRSLAALKWAEKILVVDNANQISDVRFSEAGVGEIQSLPGPILDFATVRNQAMAAVTTAWCFFVDSDEVVDEPSAETLTNLGVVLNDLSTGGLTVRRSDVFLQKKLLYGEAGNQSLVRWLRPTQAKWQGAAHEKPVVSGEVQASGLTISHYSHESINSFIEDVSRYAKIVATEKQSSPVKNVVQLICFPPLKLLYDLIVLGALLDGWRGVTYSYCMALHSVLVRIFWYEKHSSLVSQPNTSSSN